MMILSQSKGTCGLVFRWTWSSCYLRYLLVTWKTLLLYISSMPTSTLMTLSSISAMTQRIYLPGTAANCLAGCVICIERWLHLNCLKLNPAKTEMICLGHTYLKLSLTSIKLGGVNIQRSDSVRNLGVIIDASMKICANVISHQQCRRQQFLPTLTIEQSTQ